MKTIKEPITGEMIIKNSKFIVLFYNIHNEDEASNIITSIKNDYKNATHYCYAYIIGNIKRSNDDGEPSGTAGMPILNVLEKNDLNNILCVVVRYFGGVKLGAGGLIRAYGKCVREALKTGHLLDIVKCYIVTIQFNYESLKNIDFIINKVAVINKEFKDEIKYVLRLKESDLSLVDKLKLNNTKITDIYEDYFIE